MGKLRLTEVQEAAEGSQCWWAVGLESVCAEAVVKDGGPHVVAPAGGPAAGGIRLQTLPREAGLPHCGAIANLSASDSQETSGSDPKSVPHWLCDLGKGLPTWVSVSPSVEWGHLGLVRGT